METITAIGDKKLNALLKEKKYKINYEDFQYQEAVLEILKKDKKIKSLILYEKLPGEKDIYEFVTEIIKINKKIKIIIILEKENKKLIEFLNNKGIFDIFCNNKIKTEKLINFLESKNEKNIKKIKQKNIIKKIKNEYKKTYEIFGKIKNKKENKEKRIINISRTTWSGENDFYNYFFTINKK